MTHSSERDSFDVARSLRIVKAAIGRRKGVVLFTMALTVALVVAYMWIFPPTYVGTALVLVEPEKDPQRDQFYGPWSVFRKGEELATEAELMKLGDVANEVVKGMKLRYDDVYHPFLQVVTDIWARSTVGRTYRKVKQFFFPPEKKPWDLTPEEREFARTVFDFRKGIRIKSIGQSTVGEISVLGPSARVAEMSNTLVEAYIKRRQERHRQEAMAAYDALTPQVAAAQARLNEAQVRLKKYSRKVEAHFEFENERADVKVMAAEKATLYQTQAEIAKTKARLAEIERQLPGYERYEISAVQRVSNELRLKLENKLQDDRLALYELRQRFKEDSPEVQEALRSIRNTEAQMAQAEKTKVNSEQQTVNPTWQFLDQDKARLKVNLTELQVKEAEQQQIIKKYLGELSTLPDKRAMVYDMSRDLTLADEEYRALLGKQRQAYISGMTETRDIGSLKFIERAVPPERPKLPKPKLFILGAILAGFIFGIIAASIVDFVDDRVYTSTTFESIMNAPIYAVVTLPKEDRNVRLPLAGKHEPV